MLFDVNIPRPLLKELHGHEVITAQSMNWGELENGALLDVLRTGDQHGQTIRGTRPDQRHGLISAAITFASGEIERFA